MQIKQTFVKRGEAAEWGEMTGQEEPFYKFLERVTKSANELAKEYSVMSVSYPSENKAVITYVENASDDCFVSKEDVLNIIQSRLHSSADGSLEQQRLNSILLEVIALPTLPLNTN